MTVEGRKPRGREVLGKKDNVGIKSTALEISGEKPESEDVQHSPQISHLHP